MICSHGASSNLPSDISTATFIAEHQANLNTISIQVHGPGLPLTSDLVLSTVNPASCSLPSTEACVKSGSSTLRIPLPIMVHSHQSVPLHCPSPSSSLHLEAKLSSHPLKPTANLLGTKYPLSALDLKSFQPRPHGLCCASCDRILAILNADKADLKWKDLPSEHWAEMIEIWMCHQDPTWTSRLAEFTEKGFWPDKEGMMVGGSYVLINPSDARRANMVFTEGKVSDIFLRFGFGCRFRATAFLLFLPCCILYRIPLPYDGL